MVGTDRPLAVTNQPACILKIDRDVKVVCVLRGSDRSQGRHFDPHETAVDKNNSIFTAEVLGWHAEKFRLK